MVLSCNHTGDEQYDLYRGCKLDNNGLQGGRKSMAQTQKGLQLR